MIREVFVKDKSIKYNLDIKKVKNINLRIKPDGTVYVSANKRVSTSVIDEFVTSKADFIFKALDRFQNQDFALSKPLYQEDEIKRIILALCQKNYPYFKEKGIGYPKIKFRKMVSRWGSCHPLKGILTFNTNLMYAPLECVEYIVLHEFTHFLEANHSPKFYKELEKVCPRWRDRRKELKNIVIR